HRLPCRSDLARRTIAADDKYRADTAVAGWIAVTPLSVLDLAPIIEGGSAAETFRRTLDLAQHAERWGYARFWLAEHHNMPGIGSAATAILIGHVGAGPSQIRVGARRIT